MKELLPGVVVATSELMLTNSVILHDQNTAFLIDPGWLPHELQGIADWVHAQHLQVSGGFATHAHYDHLLWHPDFGEVPRLASPNTAALAVSERAKLLQQFGDGFPQVFADLLGRVSATETLDPALLPQGFEAELVFHDGHCPGHTAIWLPGQEVLIAGDMLSDVELPLPFYPDDPPAYLEALEVLTDYCRRARYVIPGHGNVGTNALERLEADLRYLDDVLTFGVSDDPRIQNEGMAEEYAHLQRLCGH